MNQGWKKLLTPRVVELLAQAHGALGEVSMLGRVWEEWKAFVRGPLVCRAAVRAKPCGGVGTRLVELLALGPSPRPSRPPRALRRAVGVVWAWDEVWGVKGEVLPDMVARIVSALKAEELKRFYRPRPGPVIPEGAEVWTLASRWRQAGVPGLVAVGLALGLWEKRGGGGSEGECAGWVLAAALAKALGMEAEGLVLWNEARGEAAQGGWVEGFVAGAWRSAGATARLGAEAMRLYREHQQLVRTWVRAPANPLKLLRLLVGRGVVSRPVISEELGVTQRTAGLCVAKLEELGLIKEITGQRRGRLYAYMPLLELLGGGD